MESRHDTLGHLLKQVLKNHPAFAANPLGDWKELVGDQIARYSRPRSLKNKVLLVAVYDSVWKHHLALLKDPLIQRINAGRPEPLVTRIVLKVGEIPAEETVLNPNFERLEKLKRTGKQPGRWQKPGRRELSAAEEELINSLPDAELRKVGRRLLQKLPVDDADRA